MPINRNIPDDENSKLSRLKWSEMLAKKYQTLHVSEKVRESIERALSHGEIPKNKKGRLSPVSQIQIHSQLLERIFHIPESHDSYRQKMIENMKREILDEYVIKKEDIPERAYKLEQEIHFREHGEVVAITDRFRSEKSENIMRDQENSLVIWIDYLASRDAMYPAWAKVWVMESLKTLGGFDKKRKSFSKRATGTVAPYPTFSAEALARTIDAVETSIRGEIPENHTSLSDADFIKIIKAKDFGKLYAEHFLALPEYSEAGLENIRWEWIKYTQWSDAKKLYDSLQWYPTGWCTAGGIWTAQGQLRTWDFYVYYSENAEKKNIIPRLAIRMDWNHIAEVRGIAADQEIDPYIAPVIEAKLSEFWEKWMKYFERIENMKKLSELFGKHFHIVDLAKKKFEPIYPIPELSLEELMFLYEVEKNIKWLGYRTDPRIKQIIALRSDTQDVIRIADTQEDKRQFGLQLLYRWHTQAVINNKDIFDIKLDKNLAKTFIESDKSIVVARNLEKFTWLDDEIARLLIRSQHHNLVIENFDTFSGFTDDTKTFQSILTILKANYWDTKDTVEQYIEKFLNLDEASAEMLLEKYFWIDFFIENIHRFSHLSARTASILLKENRHPWVRNNIERFDNLTEESLDLLIKQDRIIWAADIKEKLEKGNIDTSSLSLEPDNDLVKVLIKNNRLYEFVANFEKFTGAFDTEVAHTLIDNGYSFFVLNIVERFPTLVLDRTLAYRIIQEKDNGTMVGETVFEHIGKFKDLWTDNEFAQFLIKNWEVNTLEKHIERFDPLHLDTTKLLVDTLKTDFTSKDIEVNDKMLAIFDPEAQEWIKSQLPKAA